MQCAPGFFRSRAVSYRERGQDKEKGSLAGLPFRRTKFIVLGGGFDRFAFVDPLSDANSDPPVRKGTYKGALDRHAGAENNGA